MGVTENAKFCNKYRHCVTNRHGGKKKNFGVTILYFGGIF